MGLFDSGKTGLMVALSGVLLAGCMPDNAAQASTAVEHFDIAPNTTECVGVGPMRCLVVNGQLFYDAIQGYEHVEGQAAQICVEKSRRPDPVPADAGIYEYKKVPCTE